MRPGERAVIGIFGVVAHLLGTFRSFQVRAGAEVARLDEQPIAFAQ